MSEGAQFGWFILGAIVGWLIGRAAYRSEAPRERHH